MKFRTQSTLAALILGLTLLTAPAAQAGIGSSDLAITKTDGAAVSGIGGTVVYTIVGTNNGPDDLLGGAVTVTDTFPGILSCTWTCSASAGSSCTAAGAGNISDSVTLLENGTVTYTATCSISAAASPGTLVNTATISSSASDPVPANNSATDTNTLLPIADLAITKTDGVTSATPGGSVTYTIVAANAGPIAVTGATVTDTFPGILSCTWTCAASAGSSCTGAGAGNISDSVNLLSGGSATYTASCSIDPAATGSLVNTATISGSVVDPNPGNESATDTDTLTPDADLSITKTDSADPVALNAAYSYTVTVNNAGPSTAVGVSVADTLPAGVTLVSTSGCTEDPNGVPTCTLGTIAPGGMASYTINVTAPSSAGQVTNSATVSATTPDSVTANNTATEDTTARIEADLSITKTDGTTTATPGGMTTYTIVATNSGPNDVTGATVSDTFPATLTCTWTCAASAGSSCTAAGSGDISDSVDLLSGGTATYTAVCSIDAAATGSLVNTATISSAAFDPNTGNESATDTNTLGAVADLSITKTDSADPVLTGAAYSYTVTVANAGPSDSVGVVVTDTLPAGVTLVSTSGCAEDPNGVPTCTLGTIAAGGMASYTINVTAPGTSGLITNMASVTATTADRNPANDTTTEDTTVDAPTADLSITKTDSADPVLTGAAYSYTVTVSNAGPEDADGVVVTDTLPAGVALVSTSGCTEDPNGVPTCSLGTIAAGGMASYTINVTAPGTSGLITNMASVTATTADPTPGNNSTSEDTTVDDPEADVSITKTDGTTTAVPGANVIYTIVASNAGPQDVTGATVTDTFPGTLTCTWTCTASLGSTCAANGAGNINESVDLLNGGSASFIATCAIDPAATGSLVNTATISSPIGDPNPGNESATDTDTLTPEADLSITKSDSADPLMPGDPFTYTVTVTNNGPSVAAGVTVTDTLPAGVGFVSTTGCAEDPNGVPTCTLGGLAPAAMASYTIAVTAPATPMLITNTAMVSATTTDPNPANDTATEDTLVNPDPEADLSISTMVTPDPATLGSQVTIVVTVDNAGPDDATGVVVNGTLPGGLTLDATVGCTEDPTGVPTCSLGTVLAGGSATYIIETTATGSGSFSSNFTASSNLNDPNGANDTAAAAVTIQAIQEIPTLGEWGFALLALLLGGAAVWHLRRRQTAAGG